MLKITTERRRVRNVSYEIIFYYDNSGGYGFPCDERGNLLPMEDCARQNYDWCMAHPEKFDRFNEIERYVHTYTENATGLCSCGETVELYDQYQGACECPKCGRWYNMFGQELLHPQYWEDDE